MLEMLPGVTDVFVIVWLDKAVEEVPTYTAITSAAEVPELPISTAIRFGEPFTKLTFAW